MKRIVDARVIVAVLFIAAGILILLQNFNALNLRLDLLWSLVFIAAGLVFAGVFFASRENWWAMIPGLALIALGVIIGAPAILPQLADELLGALFLAAVGLSFWFIYARSPENWWAIIPGGAIVTLAVITAVSRLVGDVTVGGLLFIGMGLTFLVVFFAPTPRGRMRWAIIPAVALIAFGIGVAIISTPLFNYFWPLVLIVAGLVVLVRSFQWRRAG